MEKPLDEFHYHEAMDRIEMLANIVEDTIANHPVMNEESQVKALIDRACDALYDAYQAAASVRFEKFKKTVGDPMAAP